MDAEEIVRPPDAVARVSRTAVWTFAAGLFKVRVSVCFKCMFEPSYTLNVSTAESDPVKAEFPFVLLTNKASDAVTVLLVDRPGEAMTTVGEAELVEIVV